MKRTALLLCLLTLLTLASSVNAENMVRLDQLELDRSHCGWQKPLANRAVGGAPLKIAGTPYSFGVGTHAPATICVKLSGEKCRFQTAIGIDEEGLREGSVDVTFFADGKQLAQKIRRPVGLFG